MNFKDLVAPVEGEFDVDEALAEWRWLVPEVAAPLEVTAFGDLFLIARSGAVLFLDTIAGTCDEVAESVDQWNEKLNDPERLDEWFMPALTVVLQEAGVYLSRGDVYSPTHAIILGGSFTAENWKPTHWRVHFASTGVLHAQVKNLPPGTKITDIKYDPL
jgi:hypothetical protein